MGLDELEGELTLLCGVDGIVEYLQTMACVNFDTGKRCMSRRIDDQVFDAAAAEIISLRAEVAAERHRATNAEYMCHAYYNMLGPKALELAARWKKNGVTRIHFDWGGDAYKLDGEGRAQIALDFDTVAMNGAGE